MEHIIEMYNNLVASYTQWWFDTLGPTGVDILQRFTCAMFGGIMVFAFYELRTEWRRRKLQKEIEAIEMNQK